MREKFYTYRRIGYLKNDMANNLGIKITGTIYASPGVIKHIKRKHGKHLDKKIIENIIEYMKDIVDNPEYIGIFNDTENIISIQLIKKYEKYILIGIEIDRLKDYIYVSTMYPITERKIKYKIYSGKLRENM
ncbi:PBECR2 nuclease fold domain-containing protein [Clostridium sp.]|uniref:PBECR3 domain-containing polyvalent protein n=1 Tax=Clostridium sp. TaxID=1506 RepID=UPI00261ED1E6|nr:PBECR2 nuclease fold domain-containing protein [Clostridium sp.]